MKKKNIILLIILGTGIVGMAFLLKMNYPFFLKWYFTALISGITFYPTTALLFPNFKDKGWNFSKILGFAIPGLTFWLLSYLKILKYTTFNCYLVIMGYLILNIFVFSKNKDKYQINGKQLLSKILISELIFFVIFGFWTYFKCFASKLDNQTEKYMNYGFLNELYHTEYMPANDMWLSGYIINYYYFGHYLASFFAKISFSQVKETFNLFVAFVNTMTFVLPFHIAYNLGDYLVKTTEEEELKKRKIVSVSMGLFAAFAVSIGGSLYYPIYNLFVDREDPESGYGKYYYWEDSRYIGYRPETNDKTINEIIPYSSVIGDMHAHHMDTMFVFLTLGLLLDLLLSSEEEPLGGAYHTLKYTALGVVLGIQKMTNFWDFPIYMVVMILVLLFNHLTKYHFKRKTLYNILFCILNLVLVQTVVSLPFSQDLHMSATEVKLAENHSPFYKMCVYWALPTTCVLMLIVVLLVKFFKQKSKRKFWKPLFEYISKMNRADLFAFVIGCCAIGLMIIPELIYVRDIYKDPYKRTNTVYKVCYQAEILFDIASSYILIKFLSAKTKLLFKIFPILLTILYVSTFGYGINAICYAAKNFETKNFSRLDDTESFLKTKYPAEYQAIQWIKENIPMDEIIVQRTAGSYAFIPYVSVLTGNPTVLGWHGHEWVWRASKDYKTPQEVTDRWNDIWYIYNSKSEKKIKEIIEKYGISYIYISDNGVDDGSKTANRELLLSLGNVVFEEKSSLKDESVVILDVRSLQNN